MKKLITLLLVFALTVVVSCQDNSLNPTSTRKSYGDMDYDLITTNGSSASTVPAEIVRFVNKWAGLYYGDGIPEPTYGNKRGNMVHYKLKDGKVMTINGYNQAANLFEVPAQAVLPSENKLQISNYAKGTIEILNLREGGLDAYINFILEKTSDEANTDGMQEVGYSQELGAYKGTYKSISDKKDKFLAITEKGEVYFHEKVAEGSVFVSKDRKQLMIVKDGVRNTMIFEQGVYRKYDLNTTSDVDTTAVTCQVSRDFIENINGGEHYTYKSDNGDVSITINEPIGSSGIVKMTGSVCIGGFRKDGKTPWSDMIAHITILEGKTLRIMGSYNGTGTFSDDWKTLTYNGKVLKGQKR